MTSNEQDKGVIETLQDSKVVAILRTESGDSLVDVARALREGGIRHVEFTMTIPQAIEIIEQAVSQLPDVHIGVGTVLDVATATAAMDAGASYVVSPIVKPDVIACCRDRGVPVMPGAMTPTEVWTAWEAGADVVKIFPAGVVGPQFFQDLKGPFPQIRVMPTGGVNTASAPQFLRAGAFAVGVGSQLVSKSLIADGNFAEITERARDFVRVLTNN